MILFWKNKDSCGGLCETAGKVRRAEQNRTERHIRVVLQRWRRGMAHFFHSVLMLPPSSDRSFSPCTGRTVLQGKHHVWQPQPGLILCNSTSIDGTNNGPGAPSRPFGSLFKNKTDLSHSSMGDTHTDQSERFGGWINETQHTKNDPPSQGSLVSRERERERERKWDWKKNTLTFQDSFI